MKKIAYITGAIVSILYILNPSFGIFEFLPDQMPLIGNLDEALATTILLACLRNLGWLPSFLDKKQSPPPTK